MTSSPTNDAGPLEPPDAGVQSSLAQDAGSAGGGSGGGSATVIDAGSTLSPASVDAGTSSPCTTGVTGARDRTVTVMHGGLARTANVHLPASWNGRSPRAVVLNFHGRNSTPTQQNLLSGMNALSDREGFIAVHPQGVGNTWNAGLCCGEAQTRRLDDVGFVRALLDSLEASFCIDDKRVYATGLSNGGFLSHRLGCELSGRIACPCCTFTARRTPSSPTVGSRAWRAWTTRWPAGRGGTAARRTARRCSPVETSRASNGRAAGAARACTSAAFRVVVTNGRGASRFRGWARTRMRSTRAPRRGRSSSSTRCREAMSNDRLTIARS
ncbi:MAG: hypothetical protein MUC96_36075 [Myxococcaceae bacterium]|nr:hypothetical protein [Myxococcaceae bacterium]